MLCNKCGNELKEGAKFCPKCGAPQQQQTPQPNTAPQPQPIPTPQPQPQAHQVPGIGAQPQPNPIPHAQPQPNPIPHTQPQPGPIPQQVHSQPRPVPNVNQNMGTQPNRGLPNGGFMMPPQKPKTNTMALVGFILSLIGFLTSWFIFPLVLAIVGLILSCIGMKQIKENNEGGKGLAIAGIVLGALAIITGVLFWVFVACAGATYY